MKRITLFLLALLAFDARAGQINGSTATWNSSITISTEGTLDWASWGPAAGTTPEFNSKSGGSPEISTATDINSTVSAIVGAPPDPPNRSWTGGTPNATRTDTAAFHYWGSDANDGFSFTVPADTTARRLKVYMGPYQGTASLTVSLSDASATNYTTSWTESAGTQADWRIVTIDYFANSGGQTLTFQALLTSPLAGGVIGLSAATLASIASAIGPIRVQLDSRAPWE